MDTFARKGIEHTNVIEAVARVTVTGGWYNLDPTTGASQAHSNFVRSHGPFRLKKRPDTGPPQQAN
jgi:hypothetical protein